MKPAYWIAIMALAGAVLGFLFSGWVSSGLGVVLGILAGVILYRMQTSRPKV